MSLTDDLFSSDEAPVPVAPVKATQAGQTKEATEQKSAALQAPSQHAVTSVPVGSSGPSGTQATPSADRKVPEFWLRFLSFVPRPFRDAVLESSWKVHDEILAQCQGTAKQPSSTDRNSAVNTAMSNASYAAYLPYHLVKPDQMAKALELLSQDPYEFSLWIKSENPKADRVLVVGDMPKAEDVATVLDAQLAVSPARALLCGPGKAVEGILRAYGEARHYVQSNLMSVDYDANGANWDQVPGKSLDKMVDQVFRELQPDRLIVFEPSRMPATLEVLSKARQAGIPILYVDGQDVIATAKSTAYAKI